MAVIPGDGVGPEVVSASLPVLRAAARRAGSKLDTIELDWGGERYLRTGRAMPPDAVDVLRGFSAVLFGAVGRPDVPDHELIWGLIIGIRQALDLAVNVRPVQSWAGVPTVLREPDGIDLVIVRENTEGEYAGVGGRAHAATAHELGIEVAVHSRPAILRAARYAFDLARTRRGKVSLVTKSNALRHGYTLWDSVVAEVAAENPDVECEHVLVDAMAVRLVQQPRELDVLLCSNLFGDILSDLAAVLAGGMGMAPSANLLPGGDVPALFEPVHGSAPDITGRGVANPVACMLSGAMLFDHLGLPVAGRIVRDAVAAALRDPSLRTPDLGGNATTKELAAEILAAVEITTAP
ncbi:isocitrate/isopropylmalate dehydrogenase family protein [Micromonospora sp. 4G57]|uniref:Isocitrate/isopropylmalate dehydrogenase family protein n=1 Tax=Micromonospora sicca TaxID=2202420 RepID=A0ABU5JMN3_9ACTN|nr:MULTISPECIES: isocitrate/isopropylmalate dehydrogenase family protein [unclassified Micromonospora]MDZ5446976.1 isocitrate/isopropylmalate dehydrogenase family protein [Micromonospora sp. 4G57]MDZ5493653.1 isocitrate/isopropylmalate dehydrogenase family protein [Micromonospora sp. 4G53]